MSHKRYSLFLLIFLLVILGVVGVVNRIVDPFWYFRDVEIHGFNLVKPEFQHNERLVKSALVAKLHPDAIILGSSYADIGLPVAHAGFNDGGRLTAYNLAVAAANPEEIYCYALFALAQPGLKRLVLGGFGTARTSCAEYSNLGKIEYAKLLWSKNAINATLETLRHQDRRSMITADGMWYFRRYVENFQGDEGIMRTFVANTRSQQCLTPERDHVLDRRRIDRSRPPDDESTSGLRDIIQAARKKMSGSSC